MRQDDALMEERLTTEEMFRRTRDSITSPAAAAPQTEPEYDRNKDPNLSREDRMTEAERIELERSGYVLVSNARRGGNEDDALQTEEEEREQEQTVAAFAKSIDDMGDDIKEFFEDYSPVKDYEVKTTKTVWAGAQSDAAEARARAAADPTQENQERAALAGHVASRQGGNAAERESMRELERMEAEQSLARSNPGIARPVDTTAAFSAAADPRPLVYTAIEPGVTPPLQPAVAAVGPTGMMAGPR